MANTACSTRAEVSENRSGTSARARSRVSVCTRPGNAARTRPSATSISRQL
ncbi:Uncharacterised protein [Bordetella pertussis]|nr:Uncharacterised protein [Bordetella pertussis]CFW50926.1 Uncharacterised protein [Bordetella pertussis]